MSIIVKNVLGKTHLIKMLLGIMNRSESMAETCEGILAMSETFYFQLLLGKC